MQAMTWLAVLFSLVPVTMMAQVPQRELGVPDKSSETLFTSVTGAIELPAGRLLVADGLERTIRVVDFERQVAVHVGREGAGPGEWRSPSRLFAFVGDSIVMDDYANSRLLVIDPHGTPGRSFRLQASLISARATLIGIDRRGQFFLSIDRIDPTAPRGTSGIVDIVRFNQETARVDTVVTISVSKERSGARSLPDGRVELYTDLPF